MVNAAKLITQIVLTGTQIFGRAFVEAWKQAAKNGAQNAAAAGTGRAGQDAATRKTGISVEEAAQILNVDRQASAEEMLKSYEHLFKQNDPKSGGSFYLQSKVFRAKERLELDLKRRAEADGGGGDKSASPN
ncbi:Pam16-domain-containing protein [Fimicolochytrium jonesii]|uniref:Pam16-domain-containing protein n=1 Tax=Fimicolochytrium jonesii TaxID=1396493 RepID=UPI0022FF003F|nr:Pam16-domain-containing protein [Fimicolochytrium jonesii]KAI8819237.1 Pam16-domain-containing protein [Fimicolochytrium jonesii]